MSCFVQLSPDKMSRCGICNETVPRVQIYEHKRSIHGRWFMQNRARVQKVPSGIKPDIKEAIDEKTKKTFACPVCSVRFSSTSYLLRHYFAQHHQNIKADHDNELGGTGTVVKHSERENMPACRCRFCGEDFEGVEVLYKHEMEHILNQSVSGSKVEPNGMESKNNQQCHSVLAAVQVGC